MLIQEKSILARLMATENLYVEEKNVPTASFDLKNRVLIVPTLDGNLSSNVYDLFMGHEVGHALETPPQGYHDSIKDLGVNRTIMNVCEDVRIEKKIKRKFPGIRYPFLKAYEELMAMDFFGIKGVELNELNLIDRINLHTKCGALLGISFDEKEIVLLEELEYAETFPEVVKVAKKIQKHMKDKKQVPPEQQQDKQDSGSGESGDGGMNEEAGKTDPEDSEEETKPQQAQKEKVDTPEDKPEQKEVESLTDKNFRKNEHKLFDKGSNSTFYCNVPDINSDNYIVSYQSIKSLLDSHQDKCFLSVHVKDVKSNALKHFNKFRRDSDAVVSYLVKEFELRKNAAQQAKVLISKTGDINTNKIHEYNFSDDIFKRLMNVPNGKSHGLVMFIDWSGSMQPHINKTIRQLLNIVMFCRKVNIPFEVYAFSDHFVGENRPVTNEKTGDISFAHGSNVRLLNIFSSRMNNAEFTNLASYYLSFYSEDDELKKTGRIAFPQPLELGGTPLNETIILAFDLLPKFKQSTRSDIVNTIFLTDGDGHYLNVIKGMYVPKNSVLDKFVIRDPKTKCSIDMIKFLGGVRFNGFSGQQRNALLFLLRERTKSNVIGFHITSNLTAKEKLKEFIEHDDKKMTMRSWNESPELLKMYEQFRKQKFLILQSKTGFSEFYLIKSADLDIDDEEFGAKTTNIKTLEKAFSKYTGNKIQSRVVLNSFIRMIS